MANLPRSAKAGNRWGMNELTLFNIDVVDEDVEKFFGNPDLPQLTVSSVILDNLEEPSGDFPKSEVKFFAYLEDAMTIAPDEESYCMDFVTFVLKMMHYDEGRRVIHSRKEIGFEMCGEAVKVISDLCVMEYSGRYLLVVQEDKCHLPRAADPEPQLIAEAIAAFSENNEALAAAGLPILESKTFAGITMVGTVPNFYKIPVTSDLILSLARGQYPLRVTTVERLVPPVPFPDNLVSDGMKPLSNRRIILQCFQAFKQFLS